jgi:hypothetical protein
VSAHEVRLVRRSAEFRITEVPGRAASPWIVGISQPRGVESPDVEVFNPVLTIDEMQGRALTQGYADVPTGQRRVAGLSREEVFPVQTGDLNQTVQVSARDPLVRAVWARCPMFACFLLTS